jgi:hypothetical protein
MKNLLKDPKVRNVIRMTVASAVGAVIAWVTIRWAKLSTGALALLAPSISAAYFAAIHWLEEKFPQLGWLLGMLPGAKKKPTPTPTPAPAKAAVKTSKSVKKTASKKKD